eukprot:Seg4999.1 transcript_id=Seg4999.1/GoldUCD/mRNA.D3Y31 product="hypothetical protein" protein_id=Seg4999.1/GoldUCD/D3Y31
MPTDVNESADLGDSASAKKLKVSKEDECKSSDDCVILFNFIMLKQIVDMIGRCPNCYEKVMISYDLKKKKGFSQLLILSCLKCEWTEDVNSSNKIQNNEKAGPKSFEMNTRMVLAFREIGRGQAGMETFARCLNMPNCLNRSSYESINKSLHRSYSEVAQYSQKKAAIETREKLGEADPTKTVDCQVSVDGTWQRRGYPSLNGAVTLLSKENGKCLDICVLSKTCKGCQHWKGKENSEAYQQWQIEHDCQINHKESSGSMESAGAVQMFERSVPFLNLRYTGYIGDGDSKAHLSVVEAAPYGDEEIKKLECVGHVQKRMGTRLRNLTQSLRGQKLADGKGISGKNRLTKKTINTIQNYYGMAIRQNLDNVYTMKKAIFAILFHCSENKDIEDRHKFCPRSADSWCKYQSNKITGESTYKEKISLPLAVRDVLKPIFTDLSSDHLLEKCVHGLTQNVNEALHGVLWSKCPKETFNARPIVEIAASSAVVNFNDGSKGIEEVMKRLGIAPGRFMARAGRRKDLKRLDDSIRRSSEKGKKRRKKLRAVKKGFEDKEEQQDSYKAGSY